MTAENLTRIVIDFLEGVPTKKDAIFYARGFIESHFDVPAISSYYVIPYEDGFAYEVQEGGDGRPYLPAIIRRLQEDSSAVISIRSGKRVLQVSMGARDAFNAVLLPEELSSYLETNIEPDLKTKMKPYETPGLQWLMVGIGALIFGALSFFLNIGIYALDRTADKPVPTPPPEANMLPTSHWESVAQTLLTEIEKRDVNPDLTYVTAYKFINGKWTVDMVVNGIEQKDLPLQIVPAAPKQGAQK